MAKSKKKFYVVWQGRQTGIFDSWAACEAQVKGFDGARYKSFPTQAEAASAFAQDSSQFIAKKKSPTTMSAAEKKAVGSPTWESLSVDAACSGNPGVLEYQGVHTKTKDLIFHMGPFPQGTVNIGEFLAIVHGLALLKKHNSKVPMYTDSRTAMAWVRNKKIKTTLARNAKTEELFKLVDRAVQWLHDNTYDTPIIKWETKAWGEIPADFGRK
ncbi:MAG TPA: ribonuclease H [Microscillaceae bacterium]|nr:ribonuclease H [Microscillaceae bacterium]